MTMMSALAAICAFASVGTLIAYIVGVRQIRGGRPLATLTLFFTAMALWQLAMALLYNLGEASHVNVVYGAAFILLAAVSQVASAFRTRARDRAPIARELPAT